MDPAEKLKRRARIRALRGEGMTQHQAADAAGLQREIWVKLETGQNFASSAEIQAAVAKMYNTSTADMKLYIEGEIDLDTLNKRKLVVREERYRVMPAVRAAAAATGYTEAQVASFEALLDRDDQPGFDELWGPDEGDAREGPGQGPISESGPARRSWAARQAPPVVARSAEHTIRCMMSLTRKITPGGR